MHVMWISGRAPLTEERFRDIREQSARMELLTVQTLQETVPGMEAVMFLTEAEMVPERVLHVALGDAEVPRGLPGFAAAGALVQGHSVGRRELRVELGL